jgi:branched-chain amino acid transport system substrate-binding protein
VTSLSATKADAFFDGATLLACPDALKKAQAANWKAITWVSGTCISKTLMGIAGDAANGIISMTNVKDPFNPKFANDADMKLYRETVKKYQPTAEIDNGIVAYGWTQGAILVKVLEAAKKATRLAVMDSVRHMKGVTGGLLLPGDSLTTSPPNDLFMGERVQTVKYDATKKYFSDIGAPLDYEGQTEKLTPKTLIQG